MRIGHIKQFSQQAETTFLFMTLLRRGNRHNFNLNTAVLWYVFSENFIFKITVHSIFTSTQYSSI